MNDYFDDFMKSLGYRKCKKNNNDNSSNNMENDNRNLDQDMPYGYQDIDPMLITVCSEIISNVISGRLPYAVANSYGNWLQLIAQVIMVFNSQQQYQQSGPGRYYNPANKNVSNPFGDEPSYPNGGEQVKKKSKKKKKDDNRAMEDLKSEIEKLKEEIEKLKEGN